MAQTYMPGSAAEVAEILARCAQDGRCVVPTGGGTKLAWGNEIAADVLLNTQQMRNVREHSWQDLTCTVSAGMTWDALQRTLAQHGQRVALDPVYPTQATVGGVLATNDCGLLRRRYGGLRDLVLGMTIVLADGTIAQTGGKVVKNVAGYDLPKLLTGSFGTLGVITEATFRLHPVQAKVASFTVRSSEIMPLADLMHAVVTSGMSVEAMQLRNDRESYSLDVQFAAVVEALTEHEQRLRGLTTLLVESVNSAVMLTARERLFHEYGATVLKVTTLPTKLAALVAGFAALDAMPGMSAHAVGDPVGVVTAALTGPATSLAEVVHDLRARLHPLGGTVVVLHRGALPVEIDAWNDAEHPPAALEVMRAIKQEFDPLRLLSPGRFVGGL